MIKVSIIIPAFNAEQYIQKALESCLEQTLKEIEIIVVNDGSTDNTANIIKKYSNYNNIIIIDQENQGVSRTRKNGLKIAKGEYIIYLDSDDWIKPQMCEKLYQKAVDQSLDIVIFNVAREKKDKSIWIINDCPIDTIIDGHKWTQLFLDGKAFASFCNKLVRHDIYKPFKPVDNINYGEDIGVMPAIIFKTSRIGKINEVFYHYTYNHESITKKNQGIKFFQVFQALEVLDLFYKETLDDDLYLSYKKFKFYHIINFIFHEPAFDDDNYNKALHHTLIELKKFNGLPSRISLFRKAVLKYLSFRPTEKKLKRTIRIINKLHRFVI